MWRRRWCKLKSKKWCRSTSKSGRCSQYVATKWRTIHNMIIYWWYISRWSDWGYKRHSSCRFPCPSNCSENGERGSLWKRPSSDQRENHILYQNSGLPIYPVMTINHYSTHCVVLCQLLNYDTHCVVICQLLNYDLAEKFIQVFLCYNHLKIGYFDSNVFYDCSITILLIQ